MQTNHKGLQWDRAGWGGVIPAIGGVNIRQDVSPRQGRPGGHCIAPAVTFLKILSNHEFVSASISWSATSKILAIHATHNFWCTNSHLTTPKIDHVRDTQPKSDPIQNLDAPRTFSSDFSQQPRFGRTSVDIFSLVWRKLIDAAGKSFEILTIMWNFSPNIIFTFSPRLSKTQCKVLLCKT